MVTAQRRNCIHRPPLAGADLMRCWLSTAGFCLALAAGGAGISPAFGQGTAGSITAIGSVVVGGSVTITNITNQQDPAVLAEMTKIFAGQLAASAEAKVQAEAHAADLARQLGTSTAAVEQFFRLLGEQNVEPELLQRKLAEIASQYREAQSRLAVLDPEDSSTRYMVAQAKVALDAGRFA